MVLIFQYYCIVMLQTQNEGKTQHTSGGIVCYPDTVNEHTNIGKRGTQNTMSKLAEVETKRNTLAQTLAELMSKVESTQAFTDEYDKAVAEYMATKAQLALIPDMLQKAMTEDNQGEISAAAQVVIEAIISAYDTLGLEKLTGSKLQTLVFNAGHAETEAGKGDMVSPSVVFNPKRIIAQGKKTDKVASTGAVVGAVKAAANRPVYVSPDGTRKLGAAAFAQEIDPEHAAKVKYPHTLAKSLFEKTAQALGWTKEIPTE
jgi:hypothetical protein